MWKKLDLFMLITQWFDSTAGNDELLFAHSQGVDWRRCLPTVAMHLMCLGVFWVGWSWTALVMALVMYAVRMFAITGFYHRYFSHRSFKTSRITQFPFGILGASAVQLYTAFIYEGPGLPGRINRDLVRRMEDEDRDGLPLQAG